MNFKTLFALLPAAAVLMASCDRLNEDRIDPLNPDELPLVIVLSDGGDGDFEDADELGVALELLPLWDGNSRDPEGVVPEMPTDVVVFFELTDQLGFSNWSEYITGVDALYEIDDCTTSADEGIDLDATFDAATGTGSFIWPVGQKEVELVLTLNETLFDDDQLNSDERGFSLRITNVTGAESVRVSDNLTFDYRVLDEESLLGEWSLDASDPAQFEALLAFFTPFVPDLDGLEAAAVDEIVVEFKYETFELKVVLVETEDDECEAGEVQNLEIEFEADYDFDLEDLFAALSGELDFEGAVELDDVEQEFSLSIVYEISPDGSTVILELNAELDSVGEIDSQTLTLTR
jgi:hypothetical protein